MEIAFKIVLLLAMLFFCLIAIGVFLLILKILLLFNPELHIMGLKITFLNT